SLNPPLDRMRASSDPASGGASDQRAHRPIPPSGSGICHADTAHGLLIRSGVLEPRLWPPKRHVQTLELAVFIEAVAAELAAHAALFVAADRHFRRSINDRVDPAAAGADAARGLDGGFEIARPDAGR